MLHTIDVTLAYGDTIVTENLNLEIPKGQITALVGPNGSGKSTILKALARALKPRKGYVYLDDEDIYLKPPKQVAQKIALLSQNPYAPKGLSVRELVSYGRFPYQNYFGGLSEKDNSIINWALEQTGVNELANTPLSSLSGGQKQSVWLAMALAQDTTILLLDEPTTFLDIANELTLLNFLSEFKLEKGCTIVMVLHDLNQASRYAEHIIFLLEGTVLATGTPNEVITPKVLQKVYGVSAEVIKDAHTGAPIYIPYLL